jgi:hypothetical protein
MEIRIDLTPAELQAVVDVIGREVSRPELLAQHDDLCSAEFKLDSALLEYEQHHG